MRSLQSNFRQRRGSAATQTRTHLRINTTAQELSGCGWPHSIHFSHRPFDYIIYQRTTKLRILVEADREPSQGLKGMENHRWQMEKDIRTLTRRRTTSSSRPHRRTSRKTSTTRSPSRRRRGNASTSLRLIVSQRGKRRAGIH